MQSSPRPPASAGSFTNRVLHACSRSSRFTVGLALVLVQMGEPAIAAGAEPAAAIAAASAVSGPAPAVRLADFAWLTGRWVERDATSHSEESWLAPEGDSMLGVWRYVGDGKVKVLELLELRQEGDTVAFYLRHFDGALVGREEREAPIVLVATAPEPGSAVFAGKGSDGGTLRITARRRLGADGRVVGYDGAMEHGTKREEFHFLRP